MPIYSTLRGLHRVGGLHWFALSCTPALQSGNPHCGAGKTWTDLLVLGWDGSASLFFVALAFMCLAGSAMLCLIREIPQVRGFMLIINADANNRHTGLLLYGH